MKKSIATGAKRGSVGLLILETLSTSDKYGWEIIKEIETKSNGEYMLKEPSLYSSLKRMEVSGFITSYWQDSDIGGRRHYYNITEAGLKKLNNSNIEWSDSKQFVNDMFNDEDKPKHQSNVDSSIRDINKTVNEVQKTLSNLHKNDEQIDAFIKETTKIEELDLNSKSKVIEQPKKTIGGLILPSISPLQQDLFSMAINTAPKEEQPSQVNLVKDEEKAQVTVRVIEKVENKYQVAEAKHLAHSKYTSTPATYMQMPLFNEEQGVSLTNINIEEPVKEVNNNEAKNQIRFLKSLATEKDFLDHKKSLLNKSKSFLNKVDDYKPAFNYKTDTLLENSDTLYGAFDLKEELEDEKPARSTPFNNLGLEQTRLAKQGLIKEEIVEDDDEEIEEELIQVVKPSVFIDREPVAQKQKIEPQDDIDYKSILGDLFSEDENAKNEANDFNYSTGSIKDLPRINVADNINISLKAKKLAEREEKEQNIYSSPTYTYNYNNNEPKNTPAVAKPLYEDDYLTLNKPVKELRNFNSNMPRDDYSNTLLDDTYLSNIKVRTHKTEQKTYLLTTSYASSNKLNFNLSFAIFILMLIQITATYISLSNANHITSSNSLLFVIFAALSFVPVVITSLIYLLNPNKKKEFNYNLINKLTNNFIVLLIALVFIYATNLFMGMNSLNTIDFITTWLLPAVLSLNLLVFPVIKFVLLKSKKYYL